MPIYRDRTRGAFIFEFDRVIDGHRVRATKCLPKTWNQAQADAFDRQESAKLYAEATGVQRREFTIDDAVAAYLKEHAPKLKNQRGLGNEFALMWDFYRGRPISSLPDVCKAYALKGLAANGSPLAPATIRNRIRYLTAACRWAWKHKSMCEADPAAKVVTPTVKNERHVYISRREMLTIARACTNARARQAIRIAFYSGMRLGEILKARVSGTCWVLDDTKNGSRRIVPIHPKVSICAQKFIKGPKITIQRAWERARDKTGFGHVKFHDLRHSAASELINAGIDLYTVGQVLGHKDSRSTQRYSHLSVETITEAIGRIGQKIPSHPKRKTA
jgi:integrase